MSFDEFEKETENDFGFTEYEEYSNTESRKKPAETADRAYGVVTTGIEPIEITESVSKIIGTFLQISGRIFDWEHM